MGFWDFFKKNKKQIVENETVSQDGLQDWLLNKKKDIEKQEQDFLTFVRERASQLISELEEETSVLRKVNVDEKKAEEKIKFLVKENLFYYIKHLEKLTEKLKEIIKNKNVIENINSALEDFKKRSEMGYQKSTILIGKEMAAVKDSIRIFFRDLEKIIKENEDLTEKIKIVLSIDKEVSNLEKTKKIKSEVTKIMEDYNSKIESLNQEVRAMEEKIQEIKKSEKFSEEMIKKEEIENKKHELEEEINKIREIVDFKLLANFFHSFKKEMNMINAYKENFKQAFSKTDGEDLLALLREAKIQDVFISNKIQDIAKKKKEIDNAVFEDLGIKNTEEEIKKINLDIQNWNLKKHVEEKRYKKLENTLTDIINSTREELKKMNVELT